MLSRLKKKVKKRKEINVKQVMLMVFVGVIIMAIVKFKSGNPFVSHN